jgi:pimeloyl-ACP methyl ester carboxylesterase
MTTLLLIHGGLWEDMDADRFWVRPGVSEALRLRGFAVLAPNRVPRPRTWPDEVAYLVPGLPEAPVIVMAGSNGCSVAVRMAIARPASIAALLLAWPATAGDAAADARVRGHLHAAGADAGTVEALLGGETLRGVLDAELKTLSVPAGVLASAPQTPFHQASTVDTLLRLVPGAVELSPCPEPLHPDFATYLPDLVEEIARFVDRSIR